MNIKHHEAKIAKASDAMELARARYERTILDARNDGMTLMQLADVLGVSHQAVATRLERINARQPAPIAGSKRKGAAA